VSMKRRSRSTYPQRDALIVAVSRYKDARFRDLRAPSYDAPVLAEVLGNENIGGFRVRKALDKTAHAMRKEIDEFFIDRDADDFLLLHLSCHGVKDDEGRLYFAATNTNRRLLGSTGVQAEFISDLMERCRARSIVLLLDCCYSGAFATGTRGDDSVHIKERFLREVSSGRGRVVLTASNAIEYAWEGDLVSGEGQPSVFTRAIVNGLATGDAARPRQQHISIDDLYDYVSGEVRRSGAKQTPQKWALGVEGDLIIAKSVRQIPARGREWELVLVADDDTDITRFVEVNFRLEGFDVAVAHDGEDAFAQAIDLEPDVILLDVMMPLMDGYEVLTRLRADHRTAHIPVIMLTAKSLVSDLVLGLNAGADDYVSKPYDPKELIARVYAVLRRAGKAFVLSPTTGLPGEIRITQEIQERIDRGIPMSVAYADLDNFKRFVARYGRSRGDKVVTLATQVLRRAAHDIAGFDSFVGYIGGDDFIVVIPPDKADEFVRRVTSSFDARVPSLYDPEDAAAGYIKVKNRRDRYQRFPLVSMSLGIASNAERRFHEYREVMASVSKLLNRAKRRKGSSYLLDRGTKSTVAVKSRRS
jgi:diguanylate cyclase (GGDEF)-like protein